MTIVSLSPLDLSLAAVLVGLLVVLSRMMKLGLEGQLVVGALRTTAQLSLIGLVLKALFTNVQIGWIALVATIRLLAAGREVMGRQKRPLAGGWGFGIGTLSMFVSSFTVTILALAVIIEPVPWYEPRYAIPPTLSMSAPPSSRA